MRSSPPQRRLSRQDWVTAALAMVARDGIERLGVEPLAAEMGSTKGSFYWHFANRAELVDAVLEHWEREATARVIDEVETAPPPEQIVRLVTVAFGQAIENEVEWMILAAEHPQVGPVVARVHRARTDYLRRLFARAGLPPARARARARVIYAAYLGHLHLVVGTEAGEQSPAARRVFLAEVVAMASAP